MSMLHHTKTIAKREWSAYFNSPVAYVFIIIFLVLTSFFTFSVSNFYEAGQADLRGFFIWHLGSTSCSCPQLPCDSGPKKKEQGP